MGITSGTGLISGLNIDKLIEYGTATYTNQIKMAENQITLAQYRKSGMEAIESILKKLKEAVTTLSSSGSAVPMGVTGNATDKFNITASNYADAGTYSIKTIQLAQTDRYAAGAVDSMDSLIGANDGDTFKFTVGGKEVSVDVSSGTTLRDLMEGINEASGGKANATVINDGTGYRLVVESGSSGAENVIEFDAGNSTNLNFSQIQSGQDAKVMLNGIEVTSSSNTFENVINGVTFTATEESDTTYSFTVARDTSATAKNLEAFVAAYNNAIDQLNDVSKYNSEDQTSSILTGDGTINNLRYQLGSMIATTYGSGTFTSLADIGVELDRDGKLSFNSATFSAAVAKDPDSVTSLLADFETSSSEGVSVASSPNKPYHGTYTVDVTSLATQATSSSGVLGSGWTVGSNETFSVTYGGKVYSADLYANDDIDKVLERLNNSFGDSGLQAVKVTDDNGDTTIKVQTTNYGSDQKINVTSGAGFMAEGEAKGSDIAGTINGVAATGKGQLLMVTSGELEGLAIRGTELGTATVNHTAGFATTLERAITDWTSSEGLFSSEYTKYADTISTYNDRIEKLTERSSALETLLRKKYLAMETTLAGLQSQQTAVDNLTQLLLNSLNNSSNKKS